MTGVERLRVARIVLAVAAAVCALLALPVAQPVLGLLLALLLPGEAVLDAVLPVHAQLRQRGQLIPHLALAVLASLGLAVVTGLGLNLLPGGLSRLAWTLDLTLATLALTGYAWWRERSQRTAAPYRRDPEAAADRAGRGLVALRISQAALGVLLVVIAAGGALLTARIESSSETFVALSLTTVDRTHVSVTVDNHTDKPFRGTLSIRRPGTGEQKQAVQVGAGRTWQDDVRLSPGSGRLDVYLFTDGSTTPLRHLWLTPANAPSASATATSRTAP